MDIDLLKRVLPKEILERGYFCFTAVGEKKPRDAVSFAPIGANEINKSFKDIESSRHLHYANCVGIKVGNGISSIDIDGCVSEDGVIKPIAIEIIEHIKSYTELSPSGTGIRILFLSDTPFDRTKWMIKNPKIKVEYYDADDQERNGGRMVRLSGNKIREYELRRADTRALLNKYFKRVDMGTREIIETEINKTKLKFISAITRHEPAFVTIFGRAFTGMSESEWDFILLSNLYGLTSNKNEVRWLFEKSNYYKTKDDRHFKKWNNGYYANYALTNSIVASIDHSAKPYADLFDKYTIVDDVDVRRDLNDIIYLGRKFKFLGNNFLKDLKVTSTSSEESHLVNILGFLTKHHRNLEHVILDLLDKIDTEKE